MDEQPGSGNRRRARGQHDPVVAGFGAALRALRRDYGLSRQDVAAGSGLSESYIAKLEASSRQPSEKAISALAGALGIDPEDLVDFARQHAPPPDEDPATSSSTRSAAAEASDPLPAAPRPTRNSPTRRPRRLSPLTGSDPSGGELPDDLAMLLQQLESVRTTDRERYNNLHALIAALANTHSETRFSAVVDAAQQMLRYDTAVGEVEALAGITRTLLTDAGPATPTRLDPLLQLADALTGDIDTSDPATTASGIRQLLELLPAPLPTSGSAARLATAPPNTPLNLFATAITRDDEGRIWLSPTATVVDFASDEDARILRLPDGGYLIDATRCPPHRSRPRDPAKHTIRPLEVDQLPDTPDPDELQTLAAQLRTGDREE